MSGDKPAQQRRQAGYVAAAKLSEQGLTHRQIAAQLGIEVGKVKAAILLGQRLALHVKQ